MPNLSEFSARSVVWLVRTGPHSGIDDLRTRFSRLAEEHFPGAKCHFLVRDIQPLMRLLMLLANRRKAPYDVLVRIDLMSDLTPEQARGSARLKEALAVAECRTFLTTNVQFHRRSAGPGDVAMAFINTWPAHRSRVEAQQYWLDHHGPLVLKVGLPPVITSYTQVHFDVDTEHPALFDHDYQGLSFETITSQRDLVRAFAGHAALRRLNKILLADETNFTGPPAFFAFKAL